MKMIMLLIWKDVIEQLRDIKRNSLLIFIPIAIFICFYAYFQVNKVEMTFIHPITVGVVVEDESIYSQMLVDDFSSKKDLMAFFHIVQESKGILENAFMNQEIDALVTIPEGFVESLMSFGNLPIDVQINDIDPVKTMILYNGFKGYEQYISSVESAITAFYNAFYDKVDEDVYWEYNDALSLELIMMILNRNDMYVYDSITEIPSVVSVEYYFIAISMMFLLYISLFVGISFIRERNSQIFLRMGTTKITRTNYLVAKLVSSTVMLLVIIVMWTLAYSVATKEAFFYHSIRLVIFLISITVFSVLISMFVSFFFKQEQELILFSGVFVFFNAILGGSIIPIHYMPEGLKMVAKLTPNYYMIRGLLFLSHDRIYPGYDTFQSGIIVLSFVLFLCLVLGYKYQQRRGNHV